MSVSRIVAAIFKIFRRTIPHKNKEDIDEVKLQENSAKYTRYEMLAIVPLFIFGGLIGYLVYQLGQFICSFYTASENDLFYFGPDAATNMLPSFVLAFGLIIFPMNLLYKVLLGDEYKLYLEFTNRKHGWDGMVIMRPLSRVLIILGLGLFICLNNVSLRVTENHFITNGFFDLIEKSYPISVITQIIHYDPLKSSDNKADDQYRILSARGEIWNSADSWYKEDDEKQRRMIEFILEKSNLEIIKKGLHQF